MKTKSSRKRVFINRIKRLNRELFGDIAAPQFGDIYVASYPRSGNTWIRYLLANMLEPSFEWGIENLNRVIPDIHQDWPSNWIERRPRILKTHYPYRPEYKKAIYIYRDGRDVALSYYDFVVKTRSYAAPFDQFLTDYLNGQVWFGAWQKHLIDWLLPRSDVEILPVKYEDLASDPAGNLTRMCEFLRVSYTPKSITDAINRSSYQHIKKDYQPLKVDALRNMGTPGIKGGPGKWKEVFTPDQLERFWAIAGETAGQYGYTK
jgi:hypothetical protein